MQLEVSGHSRRGTNSPLNEDALFYPAGFGPTVTPAQVSAHGQLLQIADGQGSNTAALVVQELATQYYLQVGANVADNLRRAIHETNSRLFERGRAEQGQPADSGATLVSAVVKNDLLYVANIGNCRAYLIRAGRCWPLTRDHIREDGRPSRRIGLSPYLDPDIFLPLALEDGDRLVLCSNGISDYVEDEDDWVHWTGRGTVDSMTETILSTARSAGSEEDASIIVGLVTGVPPERQLSRRQQLLLIILSLFALILLVWFLIELWLMLTS